MVFMLSLRSGCFFGLSQRKSLTAAASRGRDVCRAFDFLKLLYAEIDLTALCRGGNHFFLDEKAGKKSRKNDASSLAATAWPAVLSSQRSLDSGRARIA